MVTNNAHETPILGALIKKVMIENNVTIAEFASRIHRTRTNVYSIVGRSSMDVDLLADISIALHYNFLAELSSAVEKELSNNN